MKALLTVLGDLNKGCRYCGHVEHKVSENGKLSIYMPGVECCYSALADQIGFRQGDLDRLNQQLTDREVQVRRLYDDAEQTESIFRAEQLRARAALAEQNMPGVRARLTHQIAELTLEIKRLRARQQELNEDLEL